MFDLVGLDVSYASTGRRGTFTAFNSAGTSIETAVFTADATGTRTFNLTNISRLPLADTGNHFSIDNLVLNASGVPEPTSWALMIAGVGAVGGTMRRRSKVSTSVKFA